MAHFPWPLSQSNSLDCIIQYDPVFNKYRYVHRRAEIWNLSSSVLIDIKRVREANEWDIECEHEKINSISPSVHVLFCLFYKHINNDVFDDFSKISDHFPQISEDFPKLFRRLDKCLRTFSEDYRRLPKVAEDFRGSTDDVSIIQHLLSTF